MIVRHYVACSHCSAVTMLRMGIGHSPAQEASFQCAACSHPVTVTLRLDQSAGRILSTDVEGAKLTNTEHHDYALTVHPDFPTKKGEPDALGFPAGEMSPFLEAAFGHDASEKRLRFEWAMVSHRARGDIQRIITNYEREDWRQYSQGIAEYLPGLPTQAPIDRNRALYQLLEHVMAPICTSDSHVKTIGEFTALVTAAFKANPEPYRRMLEGMLDSGRLTHVLHDLLDIYPVFLNLIPKLTPALAVWDPAEAENEFPVDREVRAFADFDALKTFYVDAYEALCRALTPAMGVVNLLNRSNQDDIPPHPAWGRRKAFATDLTDFHGKANSPKLDMFFEAEVIDRVLRTSVSPKLRNAAGHNALRYIEPESQVEYTVDRRGTKVECMSLGQFMVEILSLMRALHQVNHLLKIILVHHYMRESLPPQFFHDDELGILKK